MKNLAMMTGETIDTAMYISRVVTFNFVANGRSLSIFKTNKKVIAS